jgi:carbonic anhydrase
MLEVPDILVMGHGLCGGVQALLEGTAAEATDFIAPWIDLAAPAKARALAQTDIQDLHLACEYEAIKLSLENLSTFPWIAARIAAGTMRLSGAHFDIRSGVLSVLGGDGRFETVPRA